jgi:hypothetical protein
MCPYFRRAYEDKGREGSEGEGKGVVEEERRGGRGGGRKREERKGGAERGVKRDAGGGREGG